MRTAQPMAIMTSYNLVNGVHAANSRDLCTQAARKEWGFRGDHHDRLDHHRSPRRKYAMEMPMGRQRSDHARAVRMDGENILAALKDGSLSPGGTGRMV